MKFVDLPYYLLANIGFDSQHLELKLDCQIFTYTIDYRPGSVSRVHANNFILNVHFFLFFRYLRGVHTTWETQQIYEFLTETQKVKITGI